MITLEKIVHFGDSSIMIPAAAAITAYLLTARAWRMAWWWFVLFAFGISLVAITKIAFLGWGSGIRSIDFKALSGHATSTAAIIPVIIYLFLKNSPSVLRISGILLGIILGALMATLLVVLDEHSASEAAAGCILGSIISLSFVKLSTTLPSRPNIWLIPFSALAFFAVWYVQPPSIEYWMESIALYLSGHERPYNWATWELDT